MEETRTYELTYLVESTATDGRREEILSTLTHLLETAGAEIKKSEDWGNQRLAYEIDRKRSAEFFHLQFETSKNFIPDLESRLEQTDEILRYLTIRVTGVMKRARKNRDGEPTEDPLEYVEHTAVSFLEEFTTQQGKILPRQITGVPAKTQRRITEAIKRARHLAMMPYSDEVMKK